MSGGAVKPMSRRELTGGAEAVAVIRGELPGGGRGPETGPEATRWPDGLTPAGMGRMP